MKCERLKIKRWLLFIAFLVFPHVIVTEKFSDLVQSPFFKKGLPKYSDVSMRMLSARGTEGIAAGEAFHITRVDWSYIKDARYLSKIRERGWSFQGTLNAIVFDASMASSDEAGRAQQDHFQKDGRFIADVESPAFESFYKEQLDNWLELGVYSIQRDEPLFLGKATIAQSVLHFARMHKVAALKGTVFSLNLVSFGADFSSDIMELFGFFDYAISEVWQKNITPEFLWQASVKSRSIGKPIIYTAMHKWDVQEYRKAVAACYAFGLGFMVPWDQYAGSKEERVFLKPQNIADLYGFIRGAQPYLDGYEEAGVFGGGLVDPRWEHAPPVYIQPEQAEAITAVVRARPQRANSPLVVHLVDWMQTGKPFQLRMSLDALFGSAKVDVALLTPTHYDDKLHAAAESSGDYTKLISETEIQGSYENGWIYIEVPRIEPWGILRVVPR